MQISLSINLAEGETLSSDPAQLAADVLALIPEADASKDMCYVNVMTPPDSGSAGTPPEPMMAQTQDAPVPDED